MPKYTIETPRGRKVTLEADDESAALRGAQQWDMQDHAVGEANRVGVNPDLVLRQMQQESGGNPDATSPKGAHGPMQLMPGTAKQLGVDPADPYQNITGGVTYLKQQLDNFGGDEAKALAAYNAGPGAVRKYGGVPPFPETQAYVKALAKRGGPVPAQFPQLPRTAPALPQLAAAAPKPVSQSLGFMEGLLPVAEKLAPYSPANLIPGFREANARALVHGKARIAEREKTQTAGKLGEFAGNVLTTAAIPGGPAKAAAPFVQGGLTGALLSKGSNPAEVVRDAVYGAIGNKVGGAVVGGLGKTISGVTGDALKLANKGVPLTLGQMAGGGLRKLEDSLTSVPVVGDAIRNAQRRGIDATQRAAYNDTLAHVDEALPEQVDLGHEAHNYTKQRLGDLYDEVLQPLTIQRDTPLSQAMTAAKAKLAKIGDPKIRTDALNVLKTEVSSRFDRAGRMVGEDIKAAQSELGSHINDRMQGNTWERKAADALGEVKSAIEDLVGRTDPAAGEQLAKINTAYSFFKPLQTATAKAAVKDGGRFTVNQFAQGVTKGKGASTVAGGKAPHQDLATAASRILPSTVPDSGSAGRLFTGAGATGLMGLLGGHLPVVGPAALPAAGLIGGTALAYTRAGQKALTKLLTSRNPAARLVGQHVRRLAAPTGAVVGAGAVQAGRQ